jgi:hypothetical protein
MQKQQAETSMTIMAGRFGRTQREADKKGVIRDNNRARRCDLRIASVLS